MASDTDSNSDQNPTSPRFFWQVYSIYGVLITLGGWFFGVLLFERFTQDAFNNFQQSTAEQATSYSRILNRMDETQSCLPWSDFNPPKLAWI